MVDSSTYPTWPTYSEEEVCAAADVIRSGKVNYWTGSHGARFEEAFADWNGTAHAIALANGTVALDLALQGLMIGWVNGGSELDEVIVTPRTFIASVSTVVNAGARPIFADVDRESGNLSVASIAAAITERTRAVIVVHIGGWPAEMARICSLADEAGFAVIEDCAQAHGAAIHDRKVGSFGQVSAWSFCQDKIMTTGGEGGMVVTSDERLWERMRSFKDHGKNYAKMRSDNHPPGFRYVHDSFGTNWRMTEFQAAIGLQQLDKLASWTKQRNANAAMLVQTLKNFSEIIRCPQPDGDCLHAYYRLYAYVIPERLPARWSRDMLVAALQDRGVPVLHGTCSEVYLEEAFTGSGFRPSIPLTNARALGQTSIMFLVHPTLRRRHLEQICNDLESVLQTVLQH